jgi:hypothetical protein
MILCVLALGGATSAASFDPNVVTTLAGNGRPGIADGAAATATFLMPVALAFGSGGELYVVDEAAQRVRKIERGRVETIAGSGKVNGVAVVGGYKDGPALEARFNDPLGIAVSPTGDIFVADAGNHCIRKISAGVVTTIAGSPGRIEADGPAAIASFAAPHALAFDGDGRLYVADFGVGIRRVNPDGSVETIIKEPQGGQYFVSIAVRGAGKNVTLYASDLDRRYIVATPAENSVQMFDDGAIEETGSRPFLYRIADVGNDQFIATDVESSSIRIYRLRQPPFVGRESGPIVVGAAADDASETAGDLDGDYEHARFYDPLALAVRGGMVAVADTGNRKIRVMRLPDTRRSITGASIDELKRTNSSYRILYVGASYNFFSTSWDHSIAGILERKLNRARSELLLSKPVELATVRIDSANIGLQMQFVEEYVQPGQFDLIVFGDQPYYLQQNESVDGRDAIASAGKNVARLQKSFGPATKLAVFIYPEYAAYSFVDGLVPRELRRDQIGTAVRALTMESDAHQAEEFSSSASPVPVLDTLNVFAKLATTAGSKELWPIDESHESYRGRQVVAESLFQALRTIHPWR